MRSFQLVSVAVLAGLVGLVACASPTDAGDESNLAQVAPTGVDPQNNDPHQGPHGQPEPPMLGAHQAKAAGHKPGGNPLMTSHGGAIMTSSVVTPIFWGPSWSNATFAADKIDGINRLYAGLASATAYVASNTEYTGADGSHVGTSVSSTPSITDLAATPRSAPSTSAVLAEVCKVIGANGVSNGYYPVYTDVKRGSAGYCAWHSYGTCSGVPVQFGFFFNLDGDAGCDPQDSDTSHSQGLAAIANVTGHEWSETVTDPRNGGWWDAAGNENGDKCSWTWGSRTVTGVVNPKTGANDTWKIQGNWSNAAYNAGTGYANSSAQKGCLPL